MTWLLMLLIQGAPSCDEVIFQPTAYVKVCDGPTMTHLRVGDLSAVTYTEHDERVLYSEDLGLAIRCSVGVPVCRRVVL